MYIEGQTVNRSRRKQQEKGQNGANATPDPPTVRMPRALYTTGLDDLAQSWFKNTAAPEAQRMAMTVATMIESFRVAEGLLISPSVCCHVYGENVPLALLINLFGIAGMEQLLEEGALRFLLWRPLILHLPAAQKLDLDGVDPLSAGNTSDAAHSDPAASVELGLKGWAKKHPWAKLQKLARLAADRTELPTESLPHDAVAAVRNAYDNGALKHFGLDGRRPRHVLGDRDRQLLNRLAENTARGAALCSLEFDIYQSPRAWNDIEAFSRVRQTAGPANAVAHGLRLENIPDVPTLLARQVLSPTAILQLRNSEATREFRSWLWGQPDPRDAAAVGRAWLDKMLERPTKDRTWFKTARLTAFSVAGGLAGLAVGNPASAAIGLAVGIGMNQVLGAIDSFGVERLITPSSPRHFADSLRQHVASSVVGTAPSPNPNPNRRQRRAAAAANRRH
jgi:hypothetical protein